MSLLHRLSRRQVLFMFLMLPIIPFGSRSLICRSDPIIGLSNGLTLVVGANITGTLEDIKKVSYEIHVPEGVTQTSYESTPLWEKTKETYNLIDDQDPGQYYVIVTLQLKKGAADLVGDVSLLAADGSTLGYYSAPGSSKKPMTISFSG